MGVLLDSKLGFGVICAGAVAIGVTVALWLHGAAAPPAAPPPLHPPGMAQSVPDASPHRRPAAAATPA